MEREEAAMPSIDDHFLASPLRTAFQNLITRTATTNVLGAKSQETQNSEEEEKIS